MSIQETALIVGAGSGLSAACARLFAREGMAVHLAARRPEKLADLCTEIGASAHACDAGAPDQVAALFEALPAAPDLVLFNASNRVRKPFVEVTAEEAARAVQISCLAGFHVASEAAKRMVARGSGSILFTGASASIKGFPQSATFAMGKFGLRGLAQSMARELAPQNIHVAHFVIDGAISDPSDPKRAELEAEWGPDSMLKPEAIAESYLQTHRQHRSAWTWEIELRPWVERF
ncbi:MAG: SDR family NAD(P)-dependent oxidoreductase [Alphaproteobacteria bacterium]|nr:SDR family NAD(P)-dependent oxidoreductase [Alphaproteobacteria bacterium]